MTVPNIVTPARVAGLGAAVVLYAAPTFDAFEKLSAPVQQTALWGTTLLAVAFILGSAYYVTNRK